MHCMYMDSYIFTRLGIVISLHYPSRFLKVGLADACDVSLLLHVLDNHFNQSLMQYYTIFTFHFNEEHVLFTQWGVSLIGNSLIWCVWNQLNRSNNCVEVQCQYTLKCEVCTHYWIVITCERERERESTTKLYSWELHPEMHGMYYMECMEF